ncbi:hypothetical protein FA09DRAFT_360148 [Tilletiopsis washingtonensis]|uniref:DNA-directed RNA polymerase III subunit n=1 Tax=Tilletiopsis washingtonensis TaxID=58919 RepID=A0A316ZAS7_9BASI|nr:hypothetical protein FA09DRAFT_360148 [Tilletiopsis washingtonensis]PWN98406.1 hypothetical protein FA09DRAFT_360148 [Tilletiopsis washingtonensis]
MSRGGRGGGRGGRGGKANQNLPSMGAITFGDLGAMSKEQNALYPPIEKMPRIVAPSERERAAAQHQLEMLASMKTSPYWPREDEKKTGVELPRYSDRYRPEEQSTPSLNSVRLQKEMFPAAVWKSYMEGEERREKAKAASRRKGRTVLDWDNLEKGGAQGDDGNSADGSNASEAGELHDYEDDEDDDYAENYFDNGEDAEEDVGGGGGEGGEYE